MSKERDYAKEYNDYHSSLEQKKNRAQRNKARREAIREHGAAALKGKDVGHKTPLINGGSNTKSNRQIQTVASNRGWRKGKSGYTP